MNLKRTRLLKKGNQALYKKGPVVYWMSRDQRIEDNWALIFAQEIANQRKTSVIIVFCITRDFLNSPLRHYCFMIEGLKEAVKQAMYLNIPMFILQGDPANTIPSFLNKVASICMVTDFDPLKVKKGWKKSIFMEIDIDFFEVDTHNIVPCWIVSGKQEFGAYTIRPKIKRLFDEFIEEFPGLKHQSSDTFSTFKHYSGNTFDFNEKDWQVILKNCYTDNSVKAVEWIKPGYTAAAGTLDNFLATGIFKFKYERNDPNIFSSQSNLSPYLHFGQISPHRVALEVLKVNTDEDIRSAFMEELVIRRELSDNYCFYNNDYDSFNGLPEWAKKSLNGHRSDLRHHIYLPEELENSSTHDNLWNASQTEMAIKGKMHGYMRMYWAKKILEWSRTPEDAIKTAIYLNDRYELDGRDPNGYTGIAWSIGGLHDRAWGEREIFGKIRYMSYNGCKNKFDVRKYIETVKNLGSSG